MLLPLVCLSVLFGSTGWSEHLPQLNWMAPYRAADGASCCGMNDCFKAQLTVMSEPVNEWVRVRVTSLEDWAHRQFRVHIPSNLVVQRFWAAPIAVRRQDLQVQHPV